MFVSLILYNVYPNEHGGAVDVSRASLNCLDSSGNSPKNQPQESDTCIY